jgi:restriction endonuclease S subunit
LNLGLIRGLHLILPPPDEQAGIAEVLDSIDAAIEKSEAVIAATERLRSALLGELLTRGVPGPHTEWKTVQLREVIGLIIDHRGITPKKLGGDFAETGIPVVSAISIRNNRIVLDDETRYVSEKMYRRWMPVELHAGDVVLTSEAPLGQVAAVGVGQKYCLGQRLFGLRSEPTQMCPEFLYYSLLSPFVQAQLRMRPLEPLPREYVSPS